ARPLPLAALRRAAAARRHRPVAGEQSAAAVRRRATGNLDSKTSAEVLEMFQRLNEEEGITIILVTHDPGVAEHAKRVIRMRDGRIEDTDVNRHAVHAAAEAIAAARSGLTRRSEIPGGDRSACS